MIVRPKRLCQRQKPQLSPNKFSLQTYMPSAAETSAATVPVPDVTLPAVPPLDLYATTGCGFNNVYLQCCPDRLGPVVVHDQALERLQVGWPTEEDVEDGGWIAELPAGTENIDVQFDEVRRQVAESSRCQV